MWQGPNAAALPEGTLHCNTFANSGIPLRHHAHITTWLFAGCALPLWVQLRASLAGGSQAAEAVLFPCSSWWG